MSVRSSLLGLLLVLGSLAVGFVAARLVSHAPEPHDAQAPHDPPSVAEAPSVTRTATAESSPESVVQYPRESWAAAGLEIAPARRAPLTTRVGLTGKIALNEERIAHIYPLVEGAVAGVHVQLGQRVHKGDVLAVIHSREVGEAKLALYQARLQRHFALTKHERSEEIAQNTSGLIEALREQTPIEEIEKMFRDRPMGEYRQQLLAAYANLYKSDTDFQRLAALSDNGAVAGKQLVTAEAARNADRATMQAWLEQIDHDLKNSLLRSTQAVQEAETEVAVAETTLRILGHQSSDLASVDPTAEGEGISHYQVRAPFDGTVIAKDMVFMERADPSMQILSIADLSSVWVTADVFEEHLRWLSGLEGTEVTIRTEAWPDEVFTAEVFYTGEVMDEASRTIALRAIADNPNRRLKPGMFVNVEIPGVHESNVLQVPQSAVQEHAGEKFVFVQASEESFARRVVTTGRTVDANVEILSGLEEGQPIVVEGGFSLKSRLLSELMEGD